jgi:hypothetical protein
MVGVFIVGGELLLPEAYLGSDPHAWVAANASVLPDTLEELSAYPVEYRKAIVGALSPEKKQILWQQQIRNYIATTPGLPSERRLFLARVLAAMDDPQFFVTKDGKPALAVARDICAEAKGVLSPDEKPLFTTLGPPKATYSTWESKRLNVGQMLSSVFAVNAGRWVCPCAIDSWCGCSSCGAAFCNERPDECGCFGIWQCDGDCYE